MNLQNIFNIFADQFKKNDLLLYTKNEFSSSERKCILFDCKSYIEQSRFDKCDIEIQYKSCYDGLADIHYVHTDILKSLKELSEKFDLSIGNSYMKKDNALHSCSTPVSLFIER